LFRRPKAMASASPKVVRSSSRVWVASNAGGAGSGVPGLTTVSVGLTFRSGGTRRRSFRAAWMTSSAPGQGPCQEAQPATCKRSARTPTQPTSRGTRSVKVEGNGKAIRAKGVPPRGRTGPAATRFRWVSGHRQFTRPGTSQVSAQSLLNFTPSALADGWDPGPFAVRPARRPLLLLHANSTFKVVLPSAVSTAQQFG